MTLSRRMPPLVLALLGPLDPNPLAVAASLLDSILRPEGLLGARGLQTAPDSVSSFVPPSLHPWQSLLLDLALTSGQFWVWLNLSISSLRVATMASAFWWASHTVARLLSTELSLFPFWGALLLEGWGSSRQGLAVAADALSSLHPWWSSRRTAPLQVMLVPQEETLEGLCSCKPPGIAPAVLLWSF